MSAKAPRGASKSARLWCDRTCEWANSTVGMIRSSKMASQQLKQNAVEKRNEIVKLSDEYMKSGMDEDKEKAQDAVGELVDMLVEISEGDIV